MGRWPDLGLVPGSAGTVIFGIGGTVADGGVPGDGDGLAGKLERRESVSSVSQSTADALFFTAAPVASR
jgi:hypothetical protein